MDSQHGRRATDNEQNLEIAAIREDIAKINKLLTPISETYSTVTALGKWSMALLVLVSVVIGILLGIKNLLHRS